MARLRLGGQGGLSAAAALCAALSLPNAQLTAAHVDGVCIVRGMIEARVGFEVRLPDAWNRRYYQIGTGGFAGVIFPESLAWEAAKGNAAAMTDAGHRAGNMDASWAAGNPQAVADYGYRAIKLTSDAAGKLIAAYYGRPAAHRYFAGCSNGGRQALMAAQRWPADWDGIVAGAPANLWTRQLASFGWLQDRLRGARIDLAAIERAAIASCPWDSVARGVALDPPRCRYRSRDAAVRAAAAAGYEPTSARGWAPMMIDPSGKSPQQAVFAEQARRYLDPASQATRNALDADESLGAFRAKGGKIISYFGWADALIAPRPHLAWQRRSGTPDFYRLFMVPGMAHCQGGGVPDSFGQSPASPAAADDPAHDIRRAIEAWVENGRTPEHLVAVRWESGKPVETRTLHPRGP